jgi:hypothetical protein
MGHFKAVRLPFKRWIAAQPYLRRLRAGPESGLDALFDAAYYRAKYRGPLPARTHFVIAGAFEGASPHPLFDTAFYLRKYPDVAASGVNPLFHYLLHGAEEGRKPHPLFQPDYYAAQLGPEPSGPSHPLLLLHFLAAHEGGANPHPLFDCRAYQLAHPGARGVNPLVDFVLRGPSPVAEGAQFGLGAA